MTDTAAFVPPVIEHGNWDDAEPVLIFSLSRPAKDGEGEPTVIEYKMPGKAHVGMGLAFLRMVRIYGLEMAVSWLLEEALGLDAYLALAAEPDLEKDDLKKIAEKVRAIVLGGLEGPKGS